MEATHMYECEEYSFTLFFQYIRECAQIIKARDVKVGEGGRLEIRNRKNIRTSITA